MATLATTVGLPRLLSALADGEMVDLGLGLLEHLAADQRQRHADGRVQAG